MKEPMTQVLERGEKDLFEILISSGINCTTCQYMEDYGNDTGICKREETLLTCAPLQFLTCAPLQLCMKWRQKQEEE